MSILGKFRKNKKPKAVVVGLDGVPFTLLQDLQKKGYIPNMAKIFGNGDLGQMSVCIPEISSVSWASFMTGTQSGEHGIFGFIDLEPGTYKMYFPNYNHIKAASIWDELAKQGKKSIVLNIPGTYPAREINGTLISGFVAVDINRAVYPSSLIPRLNEFGYRIDIDTAKAGQDHEFLFKDLYATLEGRKRAADVLWNEFDWSLFIAVVTGTDRLMHFLWDAYEDETHTYHQAFIEYYTQVDALVGHMYERFLDLPGSRENSNKFYMLSDHGFTKIKTEVYLNRWLQENGYLKFQNKQPETIMDIGPGSTAFALDPSRIHINLKDKYPLGTVKNKDYDPLRRELKKGLENLTFDDGSKIVKKIFFQEELYEGPYKNQGPDLAILAHHGYDLKGRVNSDKVFEHTHLQGMHTQDDAFFFSDGEMKCSTIFEIKDIILNSLVE